MQTWMPGGPQRARAVHHPRELVRLHADEADQAEAAGLLDLAGDPVGADAGVGLVDGEDLDVDVRVRARRVSIESVAMP